MIKLGLDISTTIIGWAVLDKQIIIDKGYIDLKKINNLYEKAHIAIKEIIDIIKKYKPEHVNIEENLKQYAYRRTNADIIILLAKINGIISYYIDITLKIPISHISASSARKLLFGKAYDKKLFKDTKKFVLHNLLLIYGNNFIEDLPKMKRKDKLSKEAYDICDAIVMALY